MSFRFKEVPSSREGTTNPPSLTLRYKAIGSTDNAFVRAYAIANTPPVAATLEGWLYRLDVQIAPAGYNQWDVTVPYGPRGTPGTMPNGQSWFEYDTTGGTINVKFSKETKAKYPNTAAGHGQLIGVHGDNVDGVDIVQPALKIVVHFKHPLGVITIPYAKHLARCTGKTNNANFLTFEAGEVLFLGSTGSDGTDVEAQAAYHFGCSENLVDQVVDEITVAQKNGWDYAWVWWEDHDDSGKPAKKPAAIYVERVYDAIDMATALGFGG